MAISFRKLKQCMTLSMAVLAIVPLSSCLFRQTASTSALDVEANAPVGKSKTEQTKLVDTNPSIGPRHRSSDDYIGKLSPAIFNQLKYLPLIAPAYIPEDFSLVKYDIPSSGYALIYRSNTDQCFAIEYEASSKTSTADTAVDDNAAGAIAADSPTDRQPMDGDEEDTGPIATAGNTLDFKVFDSPLFGPEQKLFYGETAKKMAASELVSPMPDSDDTALDLLASAPDLSEAAPADIIASTDSSTGRVISPNSNQSRQTAADSNDQDVFVSQWLISDEGAYRYVSGAIVTQNYPAQMQCANVSLEEGVKIITSLAVLSADSTSATEIQPTPSANPNYLEEGSQN